MPAPSVVAPDPGLQDHPRHRPPLPALAAVGKALTAAVVLAVASLLANVQSPESLAQQEPTWPTTTSLVLSYLLNGAIWAILGIWAGRLCRHWLGAALLAITASEVSLAVHYCLGVAIGFFDWADVADNGHWFVFGLIVCGPLGVIGWLSRRPDRLGLLARLTIPAGLLLEPFWSGWFAPDWYARPVVELAGRIAGAAELGAGAGVLALVLMAEARRVRTTRAR